MTTFKPGQRVKIFYKSDGGYGLGTVVESTSWTGKDLIIETDDGHFWGLDDFRVELIEEVKA